MTDPSSRSGKLNGLVAFTAVLISLFFLYDYHHILPKRPQSVHQWRQCDGASIALTYARTGLNFFKPAAHNQHSIDGGSVAEFPIIYYIDGLLIKLFGHSDLIIRLVNLLIFYLGLFYLFRLGVLLTNNQWMALLPVILLHSFPVAAYYAVTSLPDIPSISLCIGGIFYFTRYLLKDGRKTLLPAIILFSLAGMIKPTSLIPYLAIMGSLVLMWGTQRKSTRVRLKQLILLCVPVLLTVAYVLWTKHYNEVHQNHTFLQGIKPFWELDRSFVDEITKRIKVNWIFDYTFIPTLWLSVFLAILFLFAPMKHGRMVKTGFLLLAAGSVAYFYLFFEQFYHHDYYIIEIYPLLVAAFLGALYVLSQSKLGDAFEIPVLLAIVVILGFNVNHTRNEMERRYSEDLQYHAHNDDYFDIEPKLREIGIKRTDRIIASADNSPNISLYLMDQEGYTRFKFGMNKELIEKYIADGANYVVHDTDNPEQLEDFAPYLKEILIEHKTLQVWSLQMH